MSLDVYLLGAEMRRVSHEPRIYIREEGSTVCITPEEWERRFPDRDPVVMAPHPHEPTETDEVYHANITHNLIEMAHEAGLYKVLWRPEENGITHAHMLIKPLEEGLGRLRSRPDHFEQFDAENGWGCYTDLVRFVTEYLRACRNNPQARVEVSR